MIKSIYKADWKGYYIYDNKSDSLTKRNLCKNNLLCISLIGTFLEFEHNLGDTIDGKLHKEPYFLPHKEVDTGNKLALFPGLQLLWHVFSYLSVLEMVIGFL